jgi:hypothetical protein
MRVKRRLPEVPLVIGSGIAEQNVEEYLRVADGVIVGSSLKRHGEVTAPVDPERVKRLMQRVGEGKR